MIVGEIDLVGHQAVQAGAHQRAQILVIGLVELGVHNAEHKVRQLGPHLPRNLIEPREHHPVTGLLVPQEGRVVVVDDLDPPLVRRLAVAVQNIDRSLQIGRIGVPRMKPAVEHRRDVLALQLVHKPV